MNKLIFIFFLFFTFKANAHVEHYKEVNQIKFDIYRNNKLIGYHNFDFNKKDDVLTVKSTIKFKIKKLGITLYHYYAQGTETYKDFKFTGFNSITRQNKKDKYCKIKLKNGKYHIHGSSYKGLAPDDFIIGTWWNHEIIKKKAQISAISGRIIEQNVNFLGEEELIINGNKIIALHFNFSSTDKKLSKKKKLDTDVWYDKKTLNWVKASFDKQGKWVYKLKSIK